MYNCNKLINNLPQHVEKLYIHFINKKLYAKFINYYDDYNKNIENLPSSIKEIIINHEKFKKDIKIPFGCILTIKKLNN